GWLPWRSPRLGTDAPIGSCRSSLELAHDEHLIARLEVRELCQRAILADSSLVARGDRDARVAGFRDRDAPGSYRADRAVIQLDRDQAFPGKIKGDGPVHERTAEAARPKQCGVRAIATGRARIRQESVRDGRGGLADCGPSVRPRAHNAQ